MSLLLLLLLQLLLLLLVLLQQQLFAAAVTCALWFHCEHKLAVIEWLILSGNELIKNAGAVVSDLLLL